MDKFVWLSRVGRDSENVVFKESIQLRFGAKSLRP